MKEGANKFIKDNIFLPSGADPLNTDGFDGLDGKTPTNAHGTVHFKGSTRRAKAKFVRLSDETEPKILYQLLTEYWEIPKPKLLVSVTGGAKNLSLPPKLKKRFAAGLLKVAKTPDAWVITGGTNTGIMEHVGTALKGATKACIGIATWGIVKNNDKLIENKNEKLLFGGDFSYEIDNSMAENRSYLDHNHTHFLLVDNGTKEKYGAEIDFRAAFENVIMKTEKIPSVVLMVEGGIGTIDTVKKALHATPPMAVVVIKGSGRAADLLAYAFEHINEPNLKEYLKELKNQINPDNDVYRYLRNSGVVIRGLMTEEQFDKNCLDAYKNVLCCLQKRSLITLFHLDSGNAVDEAMLQALLTSINKGEMIGDMKQKPEGLFSQLKLAITWDRPDLAQQILKDSAGVLECLHYERAMVMSLAWNCVEIFKIFIDYGVSIHKCLSATVLEGLYNYAANQGKSPLKAVLRWKRIEPTNTSNVDDDKSLQDLELENVYLYKDNVRELVKSLCGRLMLQNEELLTASAPEENIKEPYKELFYWAVLNNMQGMAFCLWQFSDGGMEKALIAAELCKQLVQEFGSYGLTSDDVINGLSETTTKFQDLAVNLIDECWKKNEDFTWRLIDIASCQFQSDLKKRSYSKQTRLKLAVRTSHKDFISHNAIQHLLNELWTNPLKSANVSIWYIFLTIICPFYVVKLDFKPLKQVKNMVDIVNDDADIGSEMDENSDDTDYLKHNDDNVILQELCPKKFPKGNLKHYGSVVLDRSASVSSSKASEWKFSDRIYYFYNMPMHIFYSHSMTFLVFLMLLTYIVLLDKSKQKPGILEYMLLIYVLAYSAEEIQQFIYGDGKDCRAKLEFWWSSYWNRLDLAAILTFYIAFSLRFEDSTNDAAELIYAVNAGLWILRLLHIFYAHSIIGPYVFMIYEMFIDMLYFLAILFVFMIAYGVTSNAILYRRQNIATMLSDIFFHPYFNIYGELFIDRDRPDNVTTRFGTPIYNSYSEPVAWGLFAGYLLVANVLLLNLLIAVFGNTFAEVKEKSSQIWKYQWYGLFMEYKQTKSALPPPLNIACIAYRLYRFCKKKESLQVENSKVSKVRINRDQLLDFEMDCVAELVRKQNVEGELLEEILETSQNTSSTVNNLQGRLDEDLKWKKSLESKLEKMEEEKRSIEEKLNTLLLK